MGKDKSKPGLPNKHLRARISFLQQAATYLTLQSKPEVDSGNNTSLKSYALGYQENLPSDNTNGHEPSAADMAQNFKINPIPNTPSTLAASKAPDTSTFTPPTSSSRLTNHLTLIAQKSQIRLQPDLKNQICKRCSTLLVEGTTSRKFIENLSRGGRKAHADVLVVECKVCGGRKRWCVGMRRQGKGKKGKRFSVGKDGGQKVESEMVSGD